jgi:hypothetical protein
MDIRKPSASVANCDNSGIASGGAPEKLLRAIFAELAAGKVAYCVMRNFERLPVSVGKSDLDILVTPGQLEAAEQAIKRALNANGGCVIARILSRSRYLKTIGKSEDGWWGLAIDIVADVDYRGMVYTDASIIIGKAALVNGVCVATKEDAAVMGLVKELINNLEVEGSYINTARQSVKVSEIHLQRGMAGFGDKVMNMVSGLLQSDQPDPVELKKIGLAMRADLRRRNKNRILCIALSELFHRMVRVIRRPGSVIVVTGMDAPARSALIERIEPILKRAFHKRVRLEYLRPNLLPPIHTDHVERKEAVSNRADAYSRNGPDGLCKSIARLIYYYLDYTLGYYLKTFPLLVGKCHLVIFNRYFHDILFNPPRMRIGLPDRILDTVFKLVPSPDLVLCLGRAPQKRHSGESETSDTKSNRQPNALGKYNASRRQSVSWIDPTDNLSDSADIALHAIMKTLESRL